MVQSTKCWQFIISRITYADDFPSFSCVFFMFRAMRTKSGMRCEDKCVDWSIMKHAVVNVVSCLSKGKCKRFWALSSLYYRNVGQKS